MDTGADLRLWRCLRNPLLIPSLVSSTVRLYNCESERRKRERERKGDISKTTYVQNGISSTIGLRYNWLCLGVSVSHYAAAYISIFGWRSLSSRASLGILLRGTRDRRLLQLDEGKRQRARERKRGGGEGKKNVTSLRFFNYRPTTKIKRVRVLAPICRSFTSPLSATRDIKKR